jgi:hypothetical protein
VELQKYEISASRALGLSQLASVSGFPSQIILDLPLIKSILLRGGLFHTIKLSNISNPLYIKNNSFWGRGIDAEGIKENRQ